MTEHAESQEWQCHSFGKEDSTHRRWHKSKSITNTSNHEVLESCRPLNEWTAISERSQKSFLDELKQQLKRFKYCGYINHQTYGNLWSGYFSIPRNGRAPSTHIAVCQSPTWMSNWGAKKMTNTMQSRYDIWFSIILNQLRHMRKKTIIAQYSSRFVKFSTVVIYRKWASMMTMISTSLNLKRTCDKFWNKIDIRKTCG